MAVSELGVEARDDAAARFDPRSDRWDEKYPELGTEPIPIEPFVSERYFELERERVFRKVWLMVGRVEQVREPGDYFVHDLPVCRTSLLIARGPDGVLRAFHNVCSHRSNKLVWDREGHCRGFSCKFHGWSYGCDGRVETIPDRESFSQLPAEGLDLSPVAVDTWEGFVFVHLDPEPAEGLREYLGEVATVCAGYPFEGVSATRFRWQVELRVNWKVAQDAFQEGYHLPIRHRRSAAASFTGPDNPHCHFLSVDLYTRHRRMSSYGNLEATPTPLQALAHRYGSSVVDRSRGDELPPGINPTRRPDWSIDTVGIFPNTLLFPARGTYLVHTFWPLAQDRTLWESSTYFPKAQNAGERFSQENSKVLLRDILLEDGPTLENTQQVLASGAKTHMHLQHQEIAVRHAAKVVEDHVNYYGSARG